MGFLPYHMRLEVYFLCAGLMHNSNILCLLYHGFITLFTSKDINWCLNSWKLMFKKELHCIWIPTIWYAFFQKGIPDLEKVYQMVMWHNVNIRYAYAYNIMHTAMTFGILQNLGIIANTKGEGPKTIGRGEVCRCLW